MTFRFADYRTILPFLRNRRRTFLDLVPEVAEGLDRNSSVLDVGCGDGRIASLLARRSKSQILAIDDSEAAIDATELTIAEARQEKFVRIELASWTELTTCTFDTILAVHLLYHIDNDDWQTFINSMLSRLNPGGKLVVVTTSKKSELHNFFAPADVIRNMVKRQSSLENVYGGYIFGEDVTNALGRKFSTTSYRTRFPIKWPFKKPRDNIEQQIDAHSAAWVKFFSFMYRLPPQTIITEFGELLRERMARANMKLTIEGGDIVHVITRS